MQISHYTKRAIIGGVLSSAIILTGFIMLGELSGYEAKVLINESKGGLNALCNTIILASGTILALLLTVLSLSINSDSSLKKDHFKYVLNIAKLDTVVIVVSLLSFLLFNLPVTESKNIPATWYSLIYYVAISVASLFSGAFIVVVLMLYSTIENIIKIVGLNLKDHPLVEDEND